MKKNLLIILMGAFIFVVLVMIGYAYYLYDHSDVYDNINTLYNTILLAENNSDSVEDAISYIESKGTPDFTSAVTTDEGIYQTTEDGVDVYYYRGAVEDNNVLFAGYCWKIIRTTKTGGIKMIYNGTPTDGVCDNTGEDSQIGTSVFNTNNDSLTYAGYMYGTVYNPLFKDMSSETTEYVYGNSVSYSDGTYTLVDTISYGDWDSIYNGGLDNYHYTCFSTGTTCTSVYYIYYTYRNPIQVAYITLADGKTVSDAISEMLDTDTTDSTIKANIDNWYSSNMTGYTDYLEDMVYCNDRSIYNYNGWNPDGGSTRSNLQFGARGRLAYTTYSPNLSCDMEDSFTVSTSNGNGKLDYPVGLISADEVVLAGSKRGESENSNNYLYTGSDYWTGSPDDFNLYISAKFLVRSTGYLGNSGNASGVRPVVSLKSETTITEGDGTSLSPYVVLINK